MRRVPEKPEETVARILKGDVRLAARLMKDVEDDMPGCSQMLRELYLHTGRAYIVGVTGSPGVGKSTIVDELVGCFRKEGKGVGVVAVDPSSPFTGGALLGDRIRMQNHAPDPGVFVRSLATRGWLGGLSRSANDIITIMDAMGKEIVIVETVGVGQAEIDIANIAHTSIVVLMPGMGDEIQALKAGIIEIGDIFVINKCEREGTGKTESELKTALHMAARKEGEWEPPVFKTEAINGKGMKELVQGIHRHREMLTRTGVLEKKIAERTKAAFLEILESELIEHLRKKLEKDGRLACLIDALLKKQTDPYSAAKEIMASELKGLDACEEVKGATATTLTEPERGDGSRSGV